MGTPTATGQPQSTMKKKPSTAPKVEELSNLLIGPGLTGQQIRKAQTTIRKPKGIR